MPSGPSLAALHEFVNLVCGGCGALSAVDSSRPASMCESMICMLGVVVAGIQWLCAVTGRGWCGGAGGDCVASKMQPLCLAINRSSAAAEVDKQVDLGSVMLRSFDDCRCLIRPQARLKLVYLCGESGTAAFMYELKRILEHTPDYGSLLRNTACDVCVTGSGCYTCDVLSHVNKVQ